MSEVPARRDQQSAPFFDGSAAGRLVIKRCTCGLYAAPDRIDCARCADPRFQWVEAKGSATLVSWIVIHDKSELPGSSKSGRVVGLVELFEGPWMYAPLLAIEGVELREGVAFVVDFVRPGDGEVIPAFRPA